MNAHAPLTPVLPNTAARPGRETRLRDIGALLVRRAPLILITTVIVLVLAILYIAQVRTQFAATSEVMLDPRKSSVETTASVLSNLPADQPTILNQIEILSSHRFAAKVVDYFHLDRDPAFTSQGFAAKVFSRETDPREIAIGKLRNSLKVTQAGFSSSIRIQVTAGDRKTASDIAAAMANLYVQEQLETKALAARQASGWLNQRVNELAQKVKEAEAAVQKYKADHRLSISAEGVTVGEQQITDLNAQLTVAQTDYDDKASKAARTAELLRSGKLATVPQVIASPLITAMRTQQTELNREIANLTARYGPNHPKMKELSTQRADLDAKIAQETARIAESVHNEAETAKSHVSSLQKTLRQSEDTNARKNQEAVELTALQSVAASTRAMYQAFLTQYSQTANQQGILRPDAYVISTSEVEETFGAQTKLLAVLSAIPAGLLLGLALAFATDRGAPAPRPVAVRTTVVPGAAPTLPKPSLVLAETGIGSRPADLVITDPQSPFAVGISSLLSALLTKGAPPLTVVVAGLTQGAGKTTLALSLARAAAKAGIRTLVIDANRPSCHLGTICGKDAATGTRSYARPGQPESFITNDTLSPAWILTADTQVPGYEAVLAPAALTGLMTNLKTQIDLVIIAAPPFGDSLAQSLLAKADTVLVAVDARQALQHAPVAINRPVLTVLTHA